MEATWIATEQSRIDAFAAVDIEQFGLLSKTSISDSLLDLDDLRSADSFNLTFTNTVTVEDDTSRERTILSLECLKSTRHTNTKVVGTFLADIVLNDACRPVGCSGVVHGGCESEN